MQGCGGGDEVNDATKSHLEQTFESAEREFPDLMERYSALLGEAVSSDERVAVMRMGLRETICQRYLLPEVCVAPGSADDRQGVLGV